MKLPDAINFYIDFKSFIEQYIKMFEWNEKYSVNISIIDEEHKELIRIMNEAIVARQHRNDLERNIEIIKRTDYVCTEAFFN